MIRNLFGGSKCRTIDVCDIFGDGSGKALYRLDGNANDESGNYHGTEVGSLKWGGGIYERGVVLDTDGQYITYPEIGGWNSTSDGAFTFWIKLNATQDNTTGVIESRSATGALGTNCGFNTADNILKGGATIGAAVSLAMTVGEWYFFSFSLVRSTNTWTVIQKDSSGTTLKTTTYVETYQTSGGRQIGASNTLSTYTFKGVIDQVRFFNRAITATEVATLYAECAPTSTVDNINPFEDGSLKALYQFNGDATDKTGVYNGTATNVTYGTGKFGQCFVGDGTARYVTNSNQILNTSLFSISMYVKISGYNSSYWTSLAGMRGDGASKRFFGFTGNLSSPAGRLGFGSNHYGTTVLSTGTWYHVVFVVSSATTGRIYLDGKLEYSGTIDWSGTVSALQYIGQNALNEYYMNGSIDQLRIFNKALAPMEVASLYNETTPMEEPMHSLVDPFKDGSGKALYRLDGNALDESGNYNGTATSVTYGNAPVGREAIFNGSASITATLSLSANTFSYSVWATVTTVSSTIQSLIDFSTGRAMLSSGNGTNAYLSYYDGTAYRVFGTYALTSATRTHIGLAVNGTSVELFINGVSQGTSACSAVTPSGTLALGKYAGSASGYLTGRENQTRIFNRVLTASEFLQLYNQGA